MGPGVRLDLSTLQTAVRSGRKTVSARPTSPPRKRGPSSPPKQRETLRSPGCPLARGRHDRPRMMSFTEPLPIDDALARSTPRSPGRERRAGRAARRGQDDARAARAARRALGQGQAPARCSSRAASPRAPRPRAWPRPWARKSARRSACACGCRALVSARTRIEVVTEGVFTRMILDDPVARGRRARCCSTNSTSARSTPISASRSRSTRRRACARTCAFWSCRRRSTARASRASSAVRR